MYFMPVQILDVVPDDREIAADTDYLQADISFSGLLNATVTFYFPVTMANHIVERFLGVTADDVSEKQQLDTMKEAANMVIGCFLGKADPEGKSKLSIPSASLVQEISFSHLASEAIIVFASEFGNLWMSYVEND